MYFYLIIALQAFCIYHLVKNKNDYYWIFIILFLPLIGSVIYLVTQVYNKRDAKTMQNELATIINPTKKITDLEKKLEFSETFQNRVNLADAYVALNDFQKAIGHYEMALKGNFQDDTYVCKQLIRCYVETKDYKKAIEYAEKISYKTEFKGSRFQFLYGLALEKTGRLEEAEANFKQIDNGFTNYEERLHYARFLIAVNKNDDARELINEMQSESRHMRSQTKRKNRLVLTEIDKLALELDK